MPLLYQYKNSFSCVVTRVTYCSKNVITRVTRVTQIFKITRLTQIVTRVTQILKLNVTRVTFYCSTNIFKMHFKA